MKLGIVYFSGTGNTVWVAQRLAEQLRARGDATTVVSCEETPTAQLDVAAWDVLGIAFPVHSSFAPSVFRAYLEQIPPSDKLLFAVTIARYWAGDTAWYAAQPLARQGCDACVRNIFSLKTATPLGCEQLDRAQEAIFCLPIFGDSQWREKHA